MKEISEIVQKPKLQTIISIATAHPFTPRPDMTEIITPEFSLRRNTQP